MFNQNPHPQYPHNKTFNASIQYTQQPLPQVYQQPTYGNQPAQTILHNPMVLTQGGIVHDMSQVYQQSYRPADHSVSYQGGMLQQSKRGSTNRSQAAHGYDPLKIPCDWDMAKLHARCRRTAPDRDIKIEPIITCPCCGFEADRTDIPLCSDPMALKYLGSGFTLYYNFLKYCIIILLIHLSINQTYNLYTNYHGTYCKIEEVKILDGHRVSEDHCPNSIYLLLSLANKLDKPDELHNVVVLNFVSLFVIMGVLLYFRKSQRQIDATIDESQLTPSDYTIVVKNIPVGLQVDYKIELKNMFETVAVLDSDQNIIVKKVVLVYDIEEISELEEELDKLVEKKKEAIKAKDFDYQHEDVIAVNEAIELVEHKIHSLETEYESTNSKFSGTAFVSFDNETMKNLVLEENKHTPIERFKSFWNKGKHPQITEDDLSWHGHKLFLEVAPEPNEVDWEFIHVTTQVKIVNRIWAWIKYILFEGAAFASIYYISMWLAHKVDHVHEQDLKGEADPKLVRKINLFSQLISFSIVLFNKFIVAKVTHYIVDAELISNKTSFQIVFAHKYTVALFANAAMISFLVDIVILKNITGYAGFIQNESQIFILNALFPPFVWLVDPWSLCKNIYRKYILSKGEKALLTQQEANKLMEEPDYLSAKRYSDVMKTMWFTFLFGSAIPLGTLFSAVGILLYYVIDYYNILRRRTVKESISMALSTEMIEMLEMIIVFSAAGNMIMSYSFFQDVTVYDIILLVVAILYSILPMEDLSNWLFPVTNNEEDVAYDIGSLDFDTDYDRENPVTKTKALALWNQHQNMHLHMSNQRK